MEPTQTKHSRPRPRKVKPLPAFLLSITDEDRDRFEYQLEVDSNEKSKTYGKEVKVVKFLLLLTPIMDSFGVERSKFDMATLTVDQLRLLTKQLGMKNCGSCNKFDCRKSIANFLFHQKEMEESDLTTTTSDLTSTSASAKKRKIDEILPQLAANCEAMVDIFRRMMEQEAKAREMKLAHSKLMLQVKIAKALGDTDELKRLMVVVKNS